MNRTFPVSQAVKRAATATANATGQPEAEFNARFTALQQTARQGTPDEKKDVFTDFCMFLASTPYPWETKGVAVMIPTLLEAQRGVLADSTLNGLTAIVQTRLNAPRLGQGGATRKRDRFKNR